MANDLFDLTGKTAVVTGGTGGSGSVLPKGWRGMGRGLWWRGAMR